MERPVFCFIFLLLIIIPLYFRLWLKVVSFINNNNVFISDTLDVYELKFNAYMKDFNKVYSGSEYEERFRNFKASLKEIKRLNALEGATVFGLTKFSDMSKEEFVERMLLKSTDVGECYNKHKICVETEDHINDTFERYDADLPTNFDWRKEGIVFPVLNQKLCSGCWAFSIVGVMESMAAKQNIDHVRRSIQELIDCSKSNNGCKGGSVYMALDYLCMKSKPVKIVTEEEYPLTLSGEMDCKTPANPTGRQLREFTYQCNVEEEKMLRQVATHGPLVAIVDATNWMNYMGGIIQRACAAKVSNHVVQIVGYANYNTTEIPYFLIRNSYGEDFGDHGYVKIGLYGNVCGIRDQVTMLDVV